MNLETLLTFSPSVFHWLTLSSALFSIGIYGVLTRRNTVGILISLEILLNAGALNFIIFNRFIAPERIDGQIMTIFIIATAAAEVVAAMAIMVVLYRHRRTMDVASFSVLRQQGDSSSDQSLSDALVSPAVKPAPHSATTHGVSTDHTSSHEEQLCRH